MTERANQIREVRKSRGWSQEQLGRRISASYSQVSRLEKDSGTVREDKGKKRGVTLYWLRQLCRALECSPLELLPEDMVPVGLGEIATLYSELSPDDRHRLKLVAEAFAKEGRMV